MESSGLLIRPPVVYFDQLFSASAFKIAGMININLGFLIFFIYRLICGNPGSLVYIKQRHKL